MTRFDAAARSLAEDDVRREMPSGLPLPPDIYVEPKSGDKETTVDALIEAQSSSLAYQANAKVIATYDKMVGALVDRSS